MKGFGSFRPSTVVARVGMDICPLVSLCGLLLPLNRRGADFDRNYRPLRLSAMPTNVRAALIQQQLTHRWVAPRCRRSGGHDRRKPSDSSRKPPDAGRRLSACRSFSTAPISPRSRNALVRARRAHPDGPTSRMMMDIAKVSAWSYRPDLRGGEHRRLLQHRRRDRRRRRVPRASTARRISRTAAGILGEVLFRPGNLGYPVFETARARSASISATIAISRKAHACSGLNGAEIVFNPSATVAGLIGISLGAGTARARRGQRLFHRRDQSRGRRSLEHRRVLRPSYFCNPRGQISPRPARDQEEVLVADMDLDLIREVRDTWQFYRDRRPESYGDLSAP